MNEIKTRPKTRDIKVRDVAALAPKELSKLMKDSTTVKLCSHDTAQEGSMTDSTAVQNAVGEFEGDAKGVTAYGSHKAYLAGKTLAQKRYDEQFRTGKTTKQADHSSGTGQPADFSGQDSPQTARAKQEYRKAKAKQQQDNRRKMKVRAEQGERRRVTDALHQSDVPSGKMVSTSEHCAATAFGRSGGKTPTVPKEKMPPQGGKTQLFVKRKKAAPYAPQDGGASPAARAKAYATRKMQCQIAKEAAQKSTQTAKPSAKGISRLKNAVVRAGKAVVRAAVGLLGGAGGLIALVLVIGGAAAVVGTPFGVFWSGQDADAQSVPQAVATINAEFAEKINQIQTEHPADSVVIHRVPSDGNDLSITNWTDIVAVFAVKTAGADADATDVVTMDDERIDLLRAIFGDMNAIIWQIEVIPGGEDESDTTILHITITSKTAEEMPDIYHFNKSQRQALTEMLKPEYAQMLAELVGTYGGELTLTDEQIRQMLANMRSDLPADRKAVVETAYSLLGKVGYFWGGKSSAIGWDSRWGTPTKVAAAGSRTTGTIRPYGLDCSGFVDWVFNNALSYVIGHGGGAAMQHTYCTPISWGNALPGDLVFYPGDSHVGVFVGTDASGNPLIIHCASSQNNVVLTGLQDFTSIGRPDIYSDGLPFPDNEPVRYQ